MPAAVTRTTWAPGDTVPSQGATPAVAPSIWTAPAALADTARRAVAGARAAGVDVRRRRAGSGRAARQPEEVRAIACIDGEPCSSERGEPHSFTLPRRPDTVNLPSEVRRCGRVYASTVTLPR